MILTFGAFISFFLALLVFGKKHKLAADYTLGVWFLVLALHLLLVYLYLYDFSYKWSFLLGLELPLPLIHGPFIFLYSRFLTGKVDWKRELWIHFLPLVILYLYQIPFFTLSLPEKVNFYHAREAQSGLYEKLIFLLFILSTLCYSTATYFILKRHERNIWERFSNPSRKNLSWLKCFLMGYDFVLLLFILSPFIHASWLEGKEYFVDGPAYIGLVILIICVGYFGISQTEIFTANPVESTTQNSRKRYKKSGLKDEQAKKIMEKLTAKMENEKLYRDPGLSLYLLAENLQENPNNLSQTINVQNGRTFNDLINYYRIRDFQSRISEIIEKKETILSLAFECGFNSKSAFNHIFKNRTGMTPSQFIKTELTRKGK